MTRRARALAFLLAALGCAALAAALATRYRSGVSAQYGGLRPVLVATADLPARRGVPPPPARGVAPGGGGPRPVQVAIAGAEALTLGGTTPEGGSVDVVVAERSGLGRRGRTYVAADGVRLLALSSPPGPGEGWSATLALTRPQALELIAAETGAREIRLLPRP